MRRVASRAFAVACLIGAALTAAAQGVEMPKELSGRWVWPAANMSQTFALEDIAATADRTFTAKLTWWTVERACALRSEPITGRITDTGLAFDAKTKCNVAFTAELNRGDSRWEGKAVTTSGQRVELSLTAK